MKRSLVLGFGLALGGLTLFAQAPAAGPDGGPHARFQGAPMGGPGMGPREHGMAALQLTDEQRAQHKAIFAAERESSRAIDTQLRTIRETMNQAAKTGASEANIDLLASQAAPLLAQQEAIRAKAFAKFYSSLSTEQKAQYESMTARSRGPRPAGRMGAAQ